MLSSPGGPFFGDKISPMSDSTNLTSSVLGVNLFDHIRHMLYSTIPAMALSLVVFTILGFTVSEGGTMGGEVATYTESIQEHFNFTFWLFIPPPLAVITLIFLKVPAIPCLITGLFLEELLRFYSREVVWSNSLKPSIAVM